MHSASPEDDPASSQPAEERRPDSPPLEPGRFVEPRHDPYAALRSPNYRRFASGFVLSSTGLQMQSTALLWEIYDRARHDPTLAAWALGFIGLARALPVIFLALPAGHVVDIVRSRKRILVVTQASFALLGLAFALASFSHAALWVFYLLIAATGVVRAFNSPCRQSLLPQIVPEGQFTSAVTWNSGVAQFAATGGPLAAGAIIGWLGGAWAVYLFTAAGCAFFAVSGALLNPRPSAPAPGRFTIPSMLAGLSHLWHEKTILAAIALDLFAVLFGGATALLPVYVAEVLLVPESRQPLALGVLRSAPYVGALLMALVLAHRPPFERAGRAMLFSVAGFGLAMVVFGLSHWFWLSLLMLVVSGALDNVSVVVRHVLVQMRTPEHLRGRVSAVNAVFIESSNELGAFESGTVAAVFGGGRIGAMISVVSGGIGTMLVVAGVAKLWPQVVRLGRLEK